jgi:hypothetical protein
MVKASGGTVVLEAPAPLMPLFRRLAGIDEVCSFSIKGITPHPFDLYVPLLSLPGILGTTLDRIPAGVPYLYAPPERTAFWRQRIAGSHLKIGIVWSSSGWNKMLAAKSCRLSAFQPLARIRGIRMFGLQKNVRAEDSEGMNGLPGFANLGTDFTDFGDTAAAISHLDLVISVDTAVAHLAGAMGKPVWLLLPFIADWRWLAGRDDSPWYPTMRLYRQHERGCWRGVFSRLERDLQDLAVAGPTRVGQLTN